MAMPYKVTVKSRGKDDIHVDVKPFPIAINETYTPLVVRSVQSIIMKPRMNTILGRKSLRDELSATLQDFHTQGIIKPKED